MSCRVCGDFLSFIPGIRVLYRLSFLWWFCQRFAPSFLPLWLEKVGFAGAFLSVLLVVSRSLASSALYLGYMRRKPKPDEFPTMLFLWTPDPQLFCLFLSTFQRFFCLFYFMGGMGNRMSTLSSQKQESSYHHFKQGNFSLFVLVCFFFSQQQITKTVCQLILSFINFIDKGSMKMEKSVTSYTCPYPSSQHQGIQDSQRSLSSGVSCISQASLA